MKILFLCRGNVARSTFGEFLYNKFTNTNDATSAGTNPSGEGDTLGDLGPIVDNVITVMNEEGCDVSGHKRRRVTEEALAGVDLIIDMAEEETIPKFVMNHPNHILWSVPDPKGTSLEIHREIKDSVKQKVLALINSMKDV
jgi:protein-tyrosine-phosphatase